MDEINNAEISDDYLFYLIIEDDETEYSDLENKNSLEVENEKKLMEVAETVEDEEIYECSSCNERFTDVMLHIKVFHKNESVVILASDDNNLNETEKNEDSDISNCFSEGSNIISDEVQDKSRELSFEYHKQISSKLECDDEPKVISNQIQLCDNEVELNENNIPNRNEQINLKDPLATEPTKSIAKPNTCTICNTTFPSSKNLKLHMRMHNPVKSKSFYETVGKFMKDTTFFVCDICGKSFDSKLKEKHLKYHEDLTPNTTCKICNRQFKNEEIYRLHMTIHKSESIDDTGHLKMQKGKREKTGIIHPYACQYCGRTFKRPHEKVRHERIHTGEKPLKCDVCGKTFRISYSLTLHLRTHTELRPYSCDFCKKKFKSYSTYAHHLLIHSDERKFKCPHCPKTFKTAVQLHGHKNTHTKPLYCRECNRPFATMSAVQAHMETHRKEINKKKFKYFCDICGASYGRPFALEEHKKDVHNPLEPIEKNFQYFGNEETIMPVECVLLEDLFKDDY